ncbi:hypothetical protein Pfo_011797 [Paulownia fortunei]|nr:hypothetical protein Pfo_011797 [Paulownia fortunei]
MQQVLMIMQVGNEVTKKPTTKWDTLIRNAINLEKGNRVQSSNSWKPLSLNPELAVPNPFGSSRAPSKRSASIWQWKIRGHFVNIHFKRLEKDCPDGAHYPRNADMENFLVDFISALDSPIANHATTGNTVIFCLTFPSRWRFLAQLALCCQLYLLLLALSLKILEACREVELFDSY